MGAWGIFTLESDEGMDVAAYLRDFVDESEDRGNLSLSNVIEALKENELLSNTTKDIDYYYDQTALTLAELYVLFNERTAFELDEEAKLEIEDLFDSIESFNADKSSLKFLAEHLMDIKNEVPDEEGQRDVVELWRESEYFEEWQQHLDFLIAKLNH